MAYNPHMLFDLAKATIVATPTHTLAAISSHLEVERHTLERAFRLVAGKSFRDFRQSVVLSKACEMLASDPALSIKEIACKLGYKSPRAFARAVYKAFGCCPCVLRARLTGQAPFPEPLTTSPRRT